MRHSWVLVVAVLGAIVEIGMLLHAFFGKSATAAAAAGTGATASAAGRREERCSIDAQAATGLGAMFL